jgi:hypothetical protein
MEMRRVLMMVQLGDVYDRPSAFGSCEPSRAVDLYVLFHRAPQFLAALLADRRAMYARHPLA